MYYGVLGENAKNKRKKKKVMLIIKVKHNFKTIKIKRSKTI